MDVHQGGVDGLYLQVVVFGGGLPEEVGVHKLPNGPRPGRIGIELYVSEPWRMKPTLWTQRDPAVGMIC